MREKKFLIIQTAFIGDVVLATPLAQILKERYAHCRVHFLVRKGNESLLSNHAYIDEVFIWRKKAGKFRQLFKVVAQLRHYRYDNVFNLQRFFSSGLITALTRSRQKTGFDKNPLSFLYSKQVAHKIPGKNDGNFAHEVTRNIALLDNPPPETVRPTLFPSDNDYKRVEALVAGRPYFVIAPASVWFTKQWPLEKWKELLNRLPISHQVFIVGAQDEGVFAEQLMEAHPKTENLCGQLSMLESVALMKKAERVFTNDSAPLHFASAANANHTAIFCSTVPAFGFGPLSENSRIAETKIDLDCRPCGLHGRRSCPLGHFKCAHTISATQVFNGEEYYRSVKNDNSPEQLLNVASYFLEKKELIGLPFKEGSFLVTSIDNVERMKEWSDMDLQEGARYILMRDATIIKYFVREVPSRIFELLDENEDREVVLNFPSIHPLGKKQKENFNLPLLITHNKDLQQLLSNSEGALLLVGIPGDILRYQRIIDKTAFYLPLLSGLSLNNALEIQVELNGTVKVAK